VGPTNLVPHGTSSQEFAGTSTIGFHWMDGPWIKQALVKEIIGRGLPFFLKKYMCRVRYQYQPKLVKAKDICIRYSFLINLCTI
jgi:hypothetical protein